MSNIHDVAKKLGMDTLAENVGELIELLKKVPKDTPVCGTDQDLGGYDASDQKYVYLSDGDGKISFGHLERDAYSAYEKGVISYDEFKVLGG